MQPQLITAWCCPIKAEVWVAIRQNTIWSNASFLHLLLNLSINLQCIYWITPYLLRVTFFQFHRLQTGRFPTIATKLINPNHGSLYECYCWVVIDNVLVSLQRGIPPTWGISLIKLLPRMSLLTGLPTTVTTITCFTADQNKPRTQIITESYGPFDLTRQHLSVLASFRW